MYQKSCIVFLLKLLIVAQASAGVFYVSTSGLPGNPGTLAQPWSITHAFQNAQANDTVWVKAGNYGAVNLNIGHPKTAFIGYTNTPGDLNGNFMPDSLNTFLQNNYDVIFPTIDGGNRATAGIGINFVTSNRINIILKNFQVRNYQIGLSIVGKDNLIENIIAYDFGNVNAFYNGTGITTYGHKNTIRNAFVLNGAAEGINIKGDSNLVAMCKVYCNDTISPYGDTDYYIYITANSATKQGKHNVIEDCYIERISKYLPHLGHGGHGLCLTISYNHKPCDFGGGYCYDSTQKEFVVENNIIRNCTTKNIFEAVMLRGDMVRYNLIEGVTSLSYGSLAILNSSRHNTFNRCHIKNTYYYKDPNTSSIYRFPGVDLRASYYGDSTAQNIPDPETNSYPWEDKFAASFNTFSNCIFENVAAGVTFNNYAEFYYPNYHPLAGQATDRIGRKRIVANNFLNCTFIAKETDTISMQAVNRPSFMMAMRGCANNSFANCIIQGFYNFESRSFALNTQPLTVERHGIIPTMHSYMNCMFYNNAFDAQIPYSATLTPGGNPPLVPGVNNIVSGVFSQCFVADPLFVDYTNKDFHLSPTSPCIDNGITISVYDDFDGNQRPCGDWHDIGAYEYQNCNTAVNETILSNTIAIFPNPSRDKFSISSQCTLNEVRVYSLLGTMVFQQLLNREVSTIWDATEIDAGVYIIQLILDNGLVESRKVVKQ